MPLKDAITLISRNFEDYKLSQPIRIDKPAVVVRPAPVVTMPVIGPSPIVQEKHPDAIQVCMCAAFAVYFQSVVCNCLNHWTDSPIQALLTLLTENCSLTVLQYDKVISYLTSRRELQVRIELGESDTNPAPATITARGRCYLVFSELFVIHLVCCYSKSNMHLELLQSPQQLISRQNCKIV